MIKFFRRIRQRLLSENKFSKYLIYAIGEIILVVIGILIALQINNRNEDRKTANRTAHLLTKVHKELAFNISEANRTIRTYRNKDSIVYKVLNKKVTFNDYKTNHRYSEVLRGIPITDLKDNAFKSLTNHVVTFTSQEDTIISKLIDLYEKDKISVDLTNELAILRLQKNSERIRDGYPWFYNYYVKGEFSDEMVDYYLNDPIHLNEVTHYGRANLGGHNGVTLNYRNNATELYKELSNYLNIKQDSAIVKDLSNYEHYIGIYTDSTNIVEVKKEKDNLIYKRRNINDSTDYAKYILYPDSKAFFTVNRLFGQLTFSNNEVTELILSRAHNKLEFKRIN